MGLGVCTRIGYTVTKSMLQHTHHIYACAELCNAALLYLARLDAGLTGMGVAGQPGGAVAREQGRGGQGMI